MNLGWYGPHAISFRHQLKISRLISFNKHQQIWPKLTTLTNLNPFFTNKWKKSPLSNNFEHFSRIWTIFYPLINRRNLIVFDVFGPIWTNFDEILLFSRNFFFIVEVLCYEQCDTFCTSIILVQNRPFFNHILTIYLFEKLLKQLWPI